MTHKCENTPKESATLAPWLYEKTARPHSFSPPRPYKLRFSTEEIGDPPMGEIAELLADEFEITREEMDAWFATGAFDRNFVGLSFDPEYMV